jgi:DNA-binding MarR family transcriptional regulator
MPGARSANLLGALALGISDEIRTATEREASEAGTAPAAVVFIGHLPGITIEQLRRALGLSHPGAVRLVDRLEANGLTERRASPADGRAVTLVLTARGRRERDRILAERHRSIRAALGALTAVERAQLDELIAKLLVTLLRDEPHAYAICRLCDERACKPCPVDEELGSRQTRATTKTMDRGTAAGTSARRRGKRGVRSSAR